MDMLLQSKLAKIAIIIALLVFIVDAVICCSRQERISEGKNYRMQSVTSNTKITGTVEK